METATNFYRPWPYSYFPGETFNLRDKLYRVLKETTERIASETFGAFSRQDTITRFSDTDLTATKVTRDTIASATIEEMAVKAIGELEEYLSLGKGWDGYFGEPFNKDLVRSAQQMVAAAAHYLEEKSLVPTEITPGPGSDGSIDIEIGLNQTQLVLTLEPDLDLERIKLYVEKEGGSYETTL